MFCLERLASVRVCLFILIVAIDTSAAVDASSTAITVATAGNSASDDFGWVYIIAAFALAAMAVVAKEALDGRCFRRHDLDQEQGISEELLLLETGVVAAAPRAAGAASTSLPSLLASKASAYDKVEASKVAESSAVTNSATAAIGTNGSEDV